DEFVCGGSAGNINLHGVEVPANIAGGDVCEWHIKPGSGAANFLGGRHNGQGATIFEPLGHRTLTLLVRRAVSLPAQKLPHGVAAWHVPQGTMFELAGSAHYRALAIAFDIVRLNAHCRN